MTNVVISPEERGMAMVTHLSGLAGYVVPFCGIIAPIVIWIMKKESPVISSIAKQALLLNLVAFALGAASAVLFITVILIPLVIMFWIALGIAAIVIPIVGAIKAGDGTYYSYPVVGIRPA